jgi:hypothetical protein
VVDHVIGEEIEKVATAALTRPIPIHFRRPILKSGFEFCSTPSVFIS